MRTRISHTMSPAVFARYSLVLALVTTIQPATLAFATRETRGGGGRKDARREIGETGGCYKTRSREIGETRGGCDWRGGDLSRESRQMLRKR